MHRSVDGRIRQQRLLDTTADRSESMSQTGSARGSAPARTEIPGPATASLKYRSESACTARKLVRRKLREWELDDLADDAQLIVTELVSNACKTGCLTFMLVKIRRITPQTVRISVRDGSRTMPVLLQAGSDDECHRGLALIHLLTAGCWGAALDTYGKTVHADLRVR
ncbi:ATP-binding protein [Kitasatospora sp. NPDC057936]|uniref:ATP-binding protein n=1 Tax=Kitasatospora sp. NPDC057936 TaxID=3346283 RepID=UPI0036DC7E10